MKKNEIIWREILTQFLDKKVVSFTQKKLASRFKFSLSTVFNALKPLRGLGAVEVRGRDFRIIDFEKILMYWATRRQLEKEIIYQTFVNKNIHKIESEMPPQTIFAAYSAWRLRFPHLPADYDKVYVYTFNSREIQDRFPFDSRPANLIVWQADSFLEDYGSNLPLAQLFVDFWNLPEWYAKDFLDALREKLNFS